MASGDWAGAREAFLKSIKADPKYLKPYEPFISASFDRRDWTTVDSLGENYLKLHPEASPDSGNECRGGSPSRKVRTRGRAYQDHG